MPDPLLPILQNDNITISWDILRLTAPAAMPEQLGAVSLKKSHDIIILSFCNIVKGQAKYVEFVTQMTYKYFFPYKCQNLQFPWH